MAGANSMGATGRNPYRVQMLSVLYLVQHKVVSSLFMLLKNVQTTGLQYSVFY